MVIDPNLALKIGQYGGTQMPDYGNMLAQATNIQGARQQQQVNTLKMQEMQIARQQAEQERLRQQRINAFIPQAMTDQGFDSNVLARLLAESGDPDLLSAVPSLQATGLEQAAKRAAAAKTTAETGKITIENETQARQLLSRFLTPANNQQEWTAALAELEQVVGPERVKGIPKEFNPRDRDVMRLRGLTPEQQSKEGEVAQYLQGAVDRMVAVNKRGVPLAEYGGFTIASGQRGSETALVQVLNELRKTNPNATIEDAARVYASSQGAGRTLVVPQNGRYYYMNSTTGQIIAEAPTPASAKEAAPPAGYRRLETGELEAIPGGPADPKVVKQQLQDRSDVALNQQHEKAKPKIEGALRAFEEKSDEVLADIARLKAHPGFNDLMGFIDARTPDMSPRAMDAAAIYDSLMAKLQFNELSEMRAASPTGGALGNVSNQDLNLLRSASGALTRSQTEASARRNFTIVENQIKNTKKRLREAFETQYSGLGATGGPTIQWNQ